MAHSLFFLIHYEIQLMQKIWSHRQEVETLESWVSSVRYFRLPHYGYSVKVMIEKKGNLLDTEDEGEREPRLSVVVVHQMKKRPRFCEVLHP